MGVESGSCAISSNTTATQPQRNSNTAATQRQHHQHLEGWLQVYEPPDPLVRGVDIRWLHGQFLPYTQDEQSWSGSTLVSALSSLGLSKPGSLPLSLSKRGAASLLSMVQAATIQQRQDKAGQAEARHPHGEAQQNTNSANIDAQQNSNTSSIGAQQNTNSANIDATSGGAAAADSPSKAAGTPSATVEQVLDGLIRPDTAQHSYYALIDAECALAPTGALHVSVLVAI